MKNESKSKGGIARANALTPEQRSEIAENAAIARWGAKTPQATHKGNFKRDFGIDVECYVLNDKHKTAVISQAGMATALGLGVGGSRLPRFVNGKTISEYVWPELREKLNNPVVFNTVNAGQKETPFSSAKGYDVTILIDICNIIVDIEKDGRLLKSQVNFAIQAHIILSASAKAGIRGLVYALSGYDATRQEIIESFKFYIRQEARDYEKEFPEQLYNEWYRIYQLPKPERNRPWKFMHLTNSQVYYPLANSHGKLQELAVAQRSSVEFPKNKRLHQFLSDIGVKALRQHLGQLLGIAQLSDNQAEYEKNFKKVFGSQPDLPFDE
jgi:hypothetical protein